MADVRWVVLGLIAATPAAARQSAPAPAGRPVVAPAEADAPADDAALTALNRQTLSGTAAQTAKIAQDLADDARRQAAFAQAQADYQRSLKVYEAETAKAAAHAAEYQKNLAAWKADTYRIASRQDHPPVPAKAQVAAVPASAPATGPTKLVCTTETITGSRVPVRHCRTVAQVAARQVADERDKDAVLHSLQTREADQFATH